ncbi:MAG TPA: pyruvate dehydrogenase (acetyl-transferring), homodimeric type [Actinobacteria bacterium]|jgi:pyruvate dehydrogenase E1 component|nr:pyruvate dehydrogenase (acetyl-transferring), homodimeric type [Actinomycetota bacterium]
MREFDAFKDQLPDVDPDETEEWLAALDDVIDTSPARAGFLLRRIMFHARKRRIGLPSMVSTHYINTIAPDEEPYFPGDEDLERRIRRLIRWNAAVMVSRANKHHDGIGGHISTYASSASLYEVGFNHFFHGPNFSGGGDHVYFQGHAAPGIYARAFLEGRIDEDKLDRFRQEAMHPGLSSYPHPRLMPEFWEFPTVSMGLSPLNAIAQARFDRYLHNRGIKDTSKQRVWAFLGDGEMDEPESMAALTLASREGLDNLVFVVNCNLQRLDGPVRGNGKIIQELESIFRGAGWHVIKVVWGREWDELLARDREGILVHKMDTTLDGEFQKYVVESGGYIREHFFGPDQRLQQLVADKSDQDLARLRRGGHDYRKLYAAYSTAVDLKDAPVVILAKTVKGWTLGSSFAGRNVTHQVKKMSVAELKTFRDLLELPIKDEDISEGIAPYYHPGMDSKEVQYLLARRHALGGFMPERRSPKVTLNLPAKDPYTEFFKGNERPVSTTMAFVALLRNLLKDGVVGKRIVPIIPDEARTFGMESLFSKFKIYSAKGQLYEPVDVATLLPYVEATDGQILEEGITEAGSMASFTAAATSYATHGEPMIPFFMFYSMFGFQRIGDLIWAAADMRSRGFLLGATNGRTTLNGEGLQHQDGHSLLLATTNPAVLSYDPAFAYETAVIVREGLRRMFGANEDVLYYLALYNENYPQAAMPDGAEKGILRGLYRFKEGPANRKHAAQILGSGSMLPVALSAQQLLTDEFDVSAAVWSATSYQQLRADALEAERWNRLHPTEVGREAFVSKALGSHEGPVIAVTDSMRAVPDQIARWVDGPFLSLGTDGFGRSDTRENLRRFFEMDADHVVVATLASLARMGEVKPEVVADAIRRFEIDPERVPPFLQP